MSDQAMLEAARGGDEVAFRRLVEPLLLELKAHCYRMAGSLHEADDLLQESLLRAWRAIPRFEGRSSLRTWLYRVTTSACLDALDRERRRTLPRELGPPAALGDPVAGADGEVLFLDPWPDLLAGEMAGSPEAQIGVRESVTLAFLTVLQALPARQRAVLLLRDVVGWPASECAQLLDMSVAAVNSALQRARETLGERAELRHRRPPSPEAEAAHRALLARYVRAWEEADVDGLVALLHEDATLSMPPLPTWFRGAAAIGRSLADMVLPPEARGRFRLLPTQASGELACAAYQLSPQSGRFEFAGLHVTTIRGGKIEDLTAFLDRSLASRFGLPEELPDELDPTRKPRAHPLP
jgi:RNA polymerase sigma-70 factor (ECF subfamily)